MREADRWIAAVAAASALLLARGNAQSAPPIIDMHMHAMRADDQGPPPLGVCQGDVQSPPEAGRPSADTFMAWLKKPPCANPIWSPMTDREVMERSLAVMKRRNVFGVVSGVLLDDWQQAAPDPVIPSLDFNFDPPSRPADEVRPALATRRYRAFGEVGIQYQGVDPSDARFEPYLAVAEELVVSHAVFDIAPVVPRHDAIAGEAQGVKVTRPVEVPRRIGVGGCAGPEVPVAHVGAKPGVL